MNIANKFPIPEFVLLDGENHLGEQLEGRTVLVHMPTNTYLEVLSVFPEDMKQFEALNPFGFVFANSEDEDENHIFLLHGTQADAGALAEIYPKAAKWYTNYALWIDDEIGKM
ncbi:MULTISPECIES: hypothetical protein [Edaphocola]|jgi:hypothetical protein|uniref:hypothetical protein n=1 Tax=Edaphocola TaxID=2601681 RepID=UPI000F96B8D2|nr:MULTISPECIES: hypothetical protein [Edaphocola]